MKERGTVPDPRNQPITKGSVLSFCLICFLVLCGGYFASGYLKAGPHVTEVSIGQNSAIIIVVAPRAWGLSQEEATKQLFDHGYQVISTKTRDLNAAVFKIDTLIDNAPIWIQLGVKWDTR